MAKNVMAGLVFDPQSLRLCIDSIAAILSMVCVPRPSVTPRSHNLSSSLPNNSKCGPMHGTVASLWGPKVREAP